MRTFRPQTSEWGLLPSSRITLPQDLQSALSYVTPPVVGVFLGGISWSRANGYGAFTTLAVDVPIGALFFVSNEILEVFEIQFLYASGISLVASCLILAGVSLATAAPEEETEKLTWRPALWHEESRELQERPWWQIYRYQSLVPLATTAAIVIWWW